MEWFLIFVSVAVVWLASLCKILHASFYPYQSSFLNNNELTNVGQKQDPLQALHDLITSKRLVFALEGLMVLKG
ncbi:hypothetical protein L2E82_16804 [Cichorium intybus]|uniref:Uncharacterized protein n=1 Tax=Cichorium intybus TaxID=13427 RepID=A0ACB9F5W7_CICIN|nr:hypothetical protein L2E82_16804 [Cichorium intybus]